MSDAEATPAGGDRLGSLPRLGVGLSFQGPLKEFVEEHLDSFDFLEIIPDIFWVDRGPDASPRFEENRELEAFLTRVAEARPLVAHSVGLSIGSAERFDRGHVEQTRRWQHRYAFPWHSDHLSFNRLDHPTGHGIDVGFPMPVPYDEEVLAMLVERVRHVQARVPVPFLLENNVYYFQLPEQELSEGEFLNRLTAETGCGLLLDLHNVFVNATNHGFDPRDYLDGLDLSRVVEIHLGGGMEVDGVYLDAHSGACPEPVWTLLEELLPRAPNARGVVFEVFGTYYPSLGPGGLREQLDRARAVVGGT